VIYNPTMIEFSPLQKIIVTNGSSRCRTGSVGYVSHAEYCQDIIKPIHVLFMQFGKSGKQRVTPYTIYCNRIKGLKDNAPEVVDELKRSRLQSVTTIEAIDTECKDAMNIPSNEFACYIATFSRYIEHLIDPNRVVRPAIINNQRQLLLNDYVLNNIDNIRNTPIENLYYLITNAYSMGISKKCDVFNKVTLFYDVMDNRSECMKRMYFCLSKKAKAVYLYKENDKFLSSRSLKILKTLHKPKPKANKLIKNIQFV